MQPTTITSMLLIAFAVGLITMTIRLYFGSWEPPATRRTSGDLSDPEVEAAVREMRQQIEDYERRHHRF